MNPQDASQPDFSVSQKVQETYPELVEMLKNSESIDAEEKQYWFDSLETMDEDQVASLRSILVDEKEQIAKIDAEYEDKNIDAIRDTEKELEKKAQEEREKVRKAEEAKHREQDEERQDELLSMLDDL